MKITLVLLLSTLLTNALCFNKELFIPFILNGNVREGYTVSLKFGSMPFELKMDTETNLTWVQCGGSCIGCSLPPTRRYEPDSSKYIKCGDPTCPELKSQGCLDPHEKCVFNTQDSSGELVRDNVTDARRDHYLFPELTFGCGFDQHYFGPTPAPFVGGVLGMANGQGSFVDQLYNLGLTRKISGHCINSKGGGYVFFGDYFINNAPTAQLESSSGTNSFEVGRADLIIDGKPTSAKGLEVGFDCGRTYTYLNDEAYAAIFELVGAIPLKRASGSGVLPVCWKGDKPFQSLRDVNAFFKPMALRFSDNYNFDLPLLSYLVITDNGNVCLGILKGSENGLGSLNLIGDISFQDKMVVYYHQLHQISWNAADCDTIPTT